MDKPKSLVAIFGLDQNAKKNDCVFMKLVMSGNEFYKCFNMLNHKAASNIFFTEDRFKQVFICIYKTLSGEYSRRAAGFPYIVETEKIPEVVRELTRPLQVDLGKHTFTFLENENIPPEVIKKLKLSL